MTRCLRGSLILLAVLAILAAGFVAQGAAQESAELKLILQITVGQLRGDLLARYYERFHDLRHSHATQLLKQGIHPKIVSERLGHSSINITLDLYSHVLPGMQLDAVLGFDRALQQAINEENENETGA